MTGATPTTNQPEVGDVVAGKYRVERVLGRGGMGVVVAAHHMNLDERVALKFLLPEVLDDAEAVSRFAREARTAAKIKSEHVARVADVGQLPNGAPYIVMEYLEGVDLSAWLEQRGVLPTEQAIDFVLQACEALAEAHALGIIHRDLKPSNLFCVQRPDGQLSIKVLDFGISKLAPPGAKSGLTQTADLMGSPHYMSPEQMRSTKNVDVRADIWSLGVILYELVSGMTPFDASTAMELGMKVATEKPRSLRQVRPDVPEALEAVVSRCLEKIPEDRYGNLGELALGLRDLAPPHARVSVDRIVGTLGRAGVSVLASTPPDHAIPASKASTPVVSPLALAKTEGPRRDAAPLPTIGNKNKKRIAALVAVVACGVGPLLWRSAHSRALGFARAIDTFELCAADANVPCASGALETLRGADPDDDRTRIAEAELRVLQGEGTVTVPLARFAASQSAAAGSLRVLSAGADPSVNPDPQFMSTLRPAVRADWLLLAGDVAALNNDPHRADGRWTEAAAIVGDPLVAPRRVRLAEKLASEKTRVASELATIEAEMKKLIEQAREGSDAVSFAATSLRARVQRVQPPLAADKLRLAIEAAAKGSQMVQARRSSENRASVEQASRPMPPIPPTDDDRAKRPSLQSQYERQKAQYQQNLERWEKQDADRSRTRTNIEIQLRASASSTLAEAESLLSDGLALAKANGPPAAP